MDAVEMVLKLVKLIEFIELQATERVMVDDETWHSIQEAKALAEKLKLQVIQDHLKAGGHNATIPTT